jgi:hypothetical protein
LSGVFFFGFFFILKSTKRKNNSTNMDSKQTVCFVSKSKLVKEAKGDIADKLSSLYKPLCSLEVTLENSLKFLG